MRFYLGVHQPNWLEDTSAPLMVSRTRLVARKTYPTPRGPWALDSGGFTELRTHGRWRITAGQYVDEVAEIVAAMGVPDFVAPMDWMAEPYMLARTGLTVDEHQARTVENYLDLLARAPAYPWLPVLQGWTVADYARCWLRYERAGVDLTRFPLVGLGSVCRRQDTGSAEDIVLALAPLRLHGFGIKTTGLRRYGYLLASADSMAWSYAGRRRGWCDMGSRCANHLHYALTWRAAVLARLNEPFQRHLWGAGGVVA